MPAPLTKAQWKKRKDRGKWSYDQYRTWWLSSNKRNPLAPATVNYDPTGGASFAPSSQADLRREAQAYINSIINPMLTRIKNTYAQRSRDSTANIRGYTNFLSQSLAGIPGQVQADYAAASQEQGAINQALGAFLTNAGMSAAQNYGGALEAIGQTGAPSTPDVSALSGLGSGLAAASAAAGSSTMSRLTAQRAADTAFARQLPGFAGLAGMQNQRRMEASLNSQMSEQLGAISDQVPGMTQQFYQGLLDREFDKAVARAGFLSDERKLQASANAATTQADMSRADVDTTLSAANGFLTNKYGEMIPDAKGNPIPYTPYSKPSKPGRTTAQASLNKRVLDSATKLATSLFSRTTKNKYNQTKPATVPNQRAYAQVYAYVAANMPGASTEQVWAVAQKALIAGGYVKASQIPSYFDFANGNVEPSPPQERPGVRPRPRVTPPAPVQPSPDTRDAASRSKTKSTAERKREEQERKERERREAADVQSREAVAMADRVATAAHHGGAPRDQTIARITAVLVQRGMDRQRAAAIARSAVARAWG